MSETNKPLNARQYEGPAELLSDHHDEFMLRENGPGGSYADHLTREYGPEGTGWDFDTKDPRHVEYNKLEREAHAAEFRLASEAMRNFVARGRYENDAGTSLRDKAERRTRHPDMGNVVLYPDGKIHQAQKSSERA